MGSEKFDIAIIGGGVVGCAILHECTKEGYKCILLEKEADLVTGASSGNRYITGVVHSGLTSEQIIE